MTVHNYICIIYIPDIHVSVSVQIHRHTHTQWPIQEPELSLHILHFLLIHLRH